MVVEDVPQRRRRKIYGDYGDCQRLKHAWFDVPSDWQATRGVPYTVRCDRCGTERRFQVSQNSGEHVASPRYIYPPGYSYDKGTRPTADEFRRMFIQRIIRQEREARKAVAS